MKIGAIGASIALFGALTAMLVTISHQPAFDTDSLQDGVALKSPGLNIMIATAWAQEPCCCDRADESSPLVMTEGQCRVVSGVCVASTACGTARREAQLALMSQPS